MGVIATTLLGYLGHNREMRRAEAETQREHERLRREDKRSTESLWGERRYEAHVVYNDALSNWFTPYMNASGQVITEGQANIQDVDESFRSLKAIVSAMSRFHYTSNQSVRDSAQWVFYAAQDATLTLSRHLAALKEGTVNEYANYEKLIATFVNARRRYENAARAELGINEVA